MRAVKIALWAMLAFVFMVVGLLIYLDPELPLRGAVRDNWEPASAAAPTAPPAPRESCAMYSEQRRALFGDLHVHTALSYDARNYGTIARPRDAYRFAKGEPIALVPSPDGDERMLQIDRPLDFAAVADHAEWLGDAYLCTDESSDSYNTSYCKGLRAEGRMNIARYFYQSRFRKGRNPDICGENGELCRAATVSGWQETQEAAEAYYDRSENCEFTTFNAYEYSRRDGLYMMHRNVIFRNERVPELPISWVETDKLEELWQGLDRDCNQAEGSCESITIPHNMNLSSGQAFRLPYRDADVTEKKDYGALRKKYEPVVEMMQAKGESECRPGLGGVVGAADEYCGFEKMVPMVGEDAPLECDMGPDDIPLTRCVGALSYARYGLGEGLSELKLTGVNPLSYGFIGSTDTHNATPGSVSEADYKGQAGRDSASPKRRLAKGGIGGKSIRANPGGLAGVWAEENTRDSIFDAMKRRETFATSGPRIQPRFFAAEELDEDICDQPDLLESAYSAGVPMGGELVGVDSPEFLLTASRDSNGNDLERIQIVKVWSEGDGEYGQAVHDVMQASVSGELDTDTCSPASGAVSFCKTWTDPEFDPNQSAAYYMRVLEVDSCRWSRRQCLALPENERPENCFAEDIPDVIQERAWSSPIWTLPGQ